MAFAIKGQTKAAVAFKGNFGVYGPILFELCMQVAYWPLLMISYVAFTIKGQTKAAVAFKGKFSVYGQILFKLCVEEAYCSPGTPDYVAFAFGFMKRVPIYQIDNVFSALQQTM